MAAIGNIADPLYLHTYAYTLANNRETVATVPAWQLHNLNPIPSNNVLINPVVEVGVFEFPLGSERFRPVRLDIPHLYGNATGVGGGAAASTNRFIAPIDAQPAGTVAFRNDRRGNGGTILADVARARGTTSARLRELNPNYFAYVNARGVAYEYGAWIWVPA
jgi:hypothetical protein